MRWILGHEVLLGLTAGFEGDAKALCTGCEVDLIECYQQPGKFYANGVGSHIWELNGVAGIEVVNPGRVNVIL